MVVTHAGMPRGVDRLIEASRAQNVSPGRIAWLSRLIDPPASVLTAKVADALLLAVEVRSREGQQAAETVPDRAGQDDRRPHTTPAQDLSALLAE